VSLIFLTQEAAPLASPHRDLSTRETRTGIQSHTITTRTPVHFDLSGIRLESLSGIFSGDTALNGETTSSDCLLGETERGERGTSSDLDLSGNDIDTSDLL
jgi:hypothetical protein